jgi:hypothetical protein
MKRVFALGMIRVALLAALALCAAPSATVAASTQAAQEPTFRVTADVYLEDGVGGEWFVFGGLTALFHQSEDNLWLNFTARQPAGVSVTEPARVQVVDGSVQASGVVSIDLTPTARLIVDLGQLDGEDDNPFEVSPGAGGGCLEGITDLLTSAQNPAGTPIAVHFDFFALSSAS